MKVLMVFMLLAITTVAYARLPLPVNDYGDYGNDYYSSEGGGQSSDEGAPCGFEGLPPCVLEEIVVTGSRPTSCYCDQEYNAENSQNTRDRGQTREQCIAELKASRERSGKGATLPPWCSEVSSAPPQNGASSSSELANGSVGYVRGGAEGNDPILSCVPISVPQSATCTENCDEVAASDDPNVKLKFYKSIGSQQFSFENPAHCSKLLGVGLDGQADAVSLKTATDEAIQGKATVISERLVRLIASACGRYQSTTKAQAATLQGNYNTCITNTIAQHKRQLEVGVQKCIAIAKAARGTTDFEPGERQKGEPVQCDEHEGFAFDYPSCTNFRAWFYGLMATETGLKTYNEGDKLSNQMRTQNRLATQVAAGDGQNAAFEAQKSSANNNAGAEERLKIFYGSKAAAITAQLAMFVDADSIDSKCSGNAACCKLFGKKSGADKISGDFFPNGDVKSNMMAEAIKAGGEAVAAAMREAEYKRQAGLTQKIQDQFNDLADQSEEGIMKYCVQNPQDPRCAQGGTARSLDGISLGNGGFGAQDFGMLDGGALTNESIDPGTSNLGAVAGSKTPVADIGGMDAEAAAAKGVFNAPSAARGGGGAPATAGAGGGASASSSANPLSNDPGAEAEKKQSEIKVTQGSVGYENGTGYAGGAWRPGSGKKEEAAANPFASLFNKDKGRGPSSVQEIDSPASDLFTKISNRYGEVQKRKALMDVR